MKAKLHLYSNLLLEWNAIHNLGGNLNAQMVQDYIEDSLYPLAFIQHFDSCIDIGSGAGFPAIPLAIYKEDSNFILVEPRKKRAAFLHYICIVLDLKNISIQKCAIEDLSQEYKVDLITSRALMKTKELIALSKDFLQDRGYFLFYKGTYLRDEIDWDITKYHQRNQRIYFYERKVL